MHSPLDTWLTQELVMLLVFGTLIAEAIAWFAMPRWYFSQGIPLFRASVKAPNWPTHDAVDTLLNEHQPESSFPAFKFHQFDQELIGFREGFGLSPFWRVNYSPLMRGALKFDKLERTVTLYGYASYSLLLFIPLATAHTLSRALGWVDSIVTVVAIALVVGTIYVLQVVRFRRLLALCGFVRQP